MMGKWLSGIRGCFPISSLQQG